MQVEQFSSFRGARVIPVLQPDSQDVMVPALSRYVSLDGQPIHTAPLATSKRFSLLGIGQTQRLLDTSILARTDRLDDRAYMESIYIRAGDQYFRARVDLPFRHHPQDQRLITVHESALKVRIDEYTRAVDGTVLSALDAFLSAGIKLEIQLMVIASINLRTAETEAMISTHGYEATFPTYAALQDEQIQASIREAIYNQYLYWDAVGYDLDAYRLNDVDRPNPNEKVAPEVAAHNLALRFVQPSTVSAAK